MLNQFFVTSSSLSRYLFSLGAIATLSCWVSFASTAKAQEPSIEDFSDPTVLPESDSSDSGEDLRPLSQSGSLLSVQGGERLMEEANQAIASQNYDLAIEKLREARQVFNQMSNFYQQLATSFSGIDNRVADNQRQLALDTAQMRDQATYQLALVHRAQGQPDLAVPLLVQIIQSQQPTRELGQQAYRQLFELGFVDAPYPRSGSEATSSAPASSLRN
ncbi:MAG: hypothetical protein WBA57_12460 [Elainellaceae cyanobacterium]